jgi:Domain of unknown function (DUF4157)
MIAPEEIQRNYPKLVQWITQRQKICMEIGERLSSKGTRDALTIGIRQIDEVRIMVEGEISLPTDPGLLQLFLKSGLGAVNGITCGHGIFVRPDAYSRHLIAHELVHVLQYERIGGIEPYLKAYVAEIVSPPYYPNGPTRAGGKASRRCCLRRFVLRGWPDQIASAN